LQIKSFGVMMREYTIKYVLTVIGDIKQAVKNVLEYVEQQNALSAECRYNIELVLNELLVNSFKHANPSAFDPVVLLAGVSDGKLTVSVTDNGSGFKYKEESESGSSDMLMMEYGRGLMLVRAYCDDIKYNLKGNSVEVEIAL
jgi:serine/threonine-protein kinase RsbW